MPGRPAARRGLSGGLWRAARRDRTGIDHLLPIRLGPDHPRVRPHYLAPSIAARRLVTTDADERLAWLLIIATIPVGIIGLALEHTFRTLFAKPLAAAIFLTINGLILLAGEALRRRAPSDTDDQHGMAAAEGHGAPLGRRPTPRHQFHQPCRRVRSGSRNASPGHLALQRGRHHRAVSDLRAARRDRSLRHRHGRRPGPRTLTSRRRPLLIPARHTRHPGRRRAETSLPGRRPHTRTGSRRRRRRRTGVVFLGEVAHPLLRDPHPDPVRHLQPARRHHLHYPLRLSTPSSKPPRGKRLRGLRRRQP